MSYDTLCDTVVRLKHPAYRRLYRAADLASLARVEAEQALKRDVLAAIRSGGDAAAVGQAYEARIDALCAEEARAIAAADVAYESRARGFARVRAWTRAAAADTPCGRR